jgi:riboflavin biosynthesis pyrimidine reductase
MTATPDDRPYPTLELLFERDGLPSPGMPGALAAAYGGALGLAGPRVYANFVSSLDGVVALPGGRESGQIISGASPADRMVMGLLRARAGAVLLGAGTFRRSPGHLWHAEAIYPPAAALFAGWRKQLGLAPRPPLVLITASGDIDPSRPALRGALVVTTAAGEHRLRGKLADGARMIVVDGTPIRIAPVLDMLRAEGFPLILTEGGPSLVGKLLAEDLLDELFLTTSPMLFGRSDDDGRRSLVHGVDLGGLPLELLSVRRHESLLFLRYQRAP